MKKLFLQLFCKKQNPLTPLRVYVQESPVYAGLRWVKIEFWNLDGSKQKVKLQFCNYFGGFGLSADVCVFDLWLKDCEINETKIYPLEGQGKTALYKVWKDFIGADYHEYHTTPVFIGWVDGRQVCATTNYQSALACWRNYAKSGGRV